MIMSIIFIVFLLAIFFAWQGQRLSACLCFGLSLLLGLIIFIHHVTTRINLNL